jgi:pyruvate ferredoxin oxidoreductase alpha subunit
MAQRDTGWIHLYVENAQEAYDTIIQAFRIAEHGDVLLPVIVGLDGFIVSHTLENVNVLPDDEVKQFVGERVLPNVISHEGKTVPFKLDPDNSMTMGAAVMPNYYFEFKRQQEEAMKNALGIIQQIHDDYAKATGRSYGNALIDEYKLTDAEIALVCVGSAAGTIKDVVDDLRAEGVKAGLLRLRTFRPFPADQVRKALENVKAVAIMDKSISFGGNGGAVFHEVRHSMYDSKSHPFLVDYIYGLGGRDTSPKDFRKVYNELQMIAHNKRVDKLVNFVGLRE